MTLFKEDNCVFDSLGWLSGMSEVNVNQLMIDIATLPTQVLVNMNTTGHGEGIFQCAQELVSTWAGIPRRKRFEKFPFLLR